MKGFLKRIRAGARKGSERYLVGIMETKKRYYGLQISTKEYFDLLELKSISGAPAEVDELESIVTSYPSFFGVKFNSILPEVVFVFYDSKERTEAFRKLKTLNLKTLRLSK